MSVHSVRWGQMGSSFSLVESLLKATLFTTESIDVVCVVFRAKLRRESSMIRLDLAMDLRLASDVGQAGKQSPTELGYAPCSE